MGIVQLIGAATVFAATDTYPSPWAAPAAQDSVFDTWGEYNRECVSYVSWMLHSVNDFEMPRGGSSGFPANATDWGTHASAAGYTVDMIPAIGSVYWKSSPQHVAYVESIPDTTHVQIEQYNASYTGAWSEVTVTTSSASGYIHFKDVTGTGGVSTIPTSDNHIQTITPTTVGLKATWYDPATANVGGWITSTAMPSTPGGTPAVVARPGVNKVDIFVRGNNSSIYTTWYDFQHGSWGGWINLGGNLASNPQVVATSDGHDQVFATGSNLVQQMWFNPGDGTHPAGWTTSAGMAGSSPVSSPALVVRPGSDPKVDALVRAANNQVYETWYSFGVGNWGGWSPMGGTVSSDPQAVATSDGHYQVFGTGNNVIQQKWLEPVGGTQGGNWTTSPALGNNALGTPAIAPRSGQNVLDAYVYGNNNQVYHNWYSFQSGLWSGWSGMGGNANNLRTVLTSDGHDQLFGVGNSLVQENWFAQDGSYGAWKSF